MIWNRSTLENKLTHFCKHWCSVRGVRLANGSRHHLIAAVKCMTRKDLQSHCMRPKAQVFASDLSITGASLKARVFASDFSITGASLKAPAFVQYNRRFSQGLSIGM